MSTTTAGRLFITALDSLERLEIQYVPKELTIERVADYGDIRIVGRNNPFHHYVNGHENLDIDLDFHSIEKAREDVVKKCNWLKSISMNDGYDNPPEVIRLTFGRLFREEIWVIRSVRINYAQFEERTGFLPVQAYVKLGLSLSPKQNTKRSDVIWR